MNLLNLWCGYVSGIFDRKVPVVIVGNKKDIKSINTEFIEEALNRMSQKVNIVSYFETSAITGEGIDILFDRLFRLAQQYSLVVHT